MNEFLVLLENAAGAGWLALCVIALAAIGMLVHDRMTSKRALADRSEHERKAA